MRLTGALLRTWRNASSLILAAPGNLQRTVNYEVLMLIRSSKSNFFPSACVFPGGKVSRDDYSEDWRDVFSRAGYDNLEESLPSVKQDPACRSPMLIEREFDSSIASDVAYRLCAIRETFEEAGVFLHKSSKNEPLDQEALNTWRKIVHNDASKFIECCNDLGVVPDIWSLHEWSNWMTPTHMPEMHKNRRFDTMFYLTCLNQKLPQGNECELEVVSSHVSIQL